MVNYSALQRNKVVTHAATWMDHKSMMLNERSQTQKVICHMIAFDILEKIKLWGWKTNRSLLPGAGEGRVDYERSQGMLHILTVVGVRQLHAFVRIHRPIH